ncbi:MAG: class I SAM-dependent methyltransferase [Pyrinomonadaceae bacterium]|nr:class I SAM-dependent methyltransferase [Pyrinomonadaceae bacterium]
MKPFEFAYLCAEPFLPPLMKLVRRRLMSSPQVRAKDARLLDVGGRKSHYTIALPAQVTITDLPRETEVQKQLNLGISDQTICQTLGRRTNVREVLFDDMTCSALPDDTFDGVVAVEVLEHVEQDGDFVREVYRVLKSQGVFLMTTPNGDFVKNTNPDHKRHYTRQQLTDLLSSVFDNVTVEYAIRGGTFRRWGLRSWSPRRPIVTALSMFANLVNTIESSGEAIKRQAKGTHHLVATAQKSGRTVRNASLLHSSTRERLIRVG